LFRAGAVAVVLPSSIAIHSVNDLPDGKRNEMDAEFRDIFELSCEKGFAAIRGDSRRGRMAPGE